MKLKGEEEGMVVSQDTVQQGIPVAATDDDDDDDDDDLSAAVT